MIAAQTVGIQMAEEIPFLWATSLLINHHEKASEVNNMNLGTTRC